MTKHEKAMLKSRILQLCRMKAAGKPADLARRFDISERTVKRHIRELRQEGHTLVFDHYLMSYVLQNV